MQSGSGGEAGAIKLICSDVDGTLLTRKHVASERTSKTILRAMQLCTFACATGRARSGAHQALGSHLAEQLSKAPGVFLNGLIVYGHDDLLLRDTCLTPDIVLEAAAFASERGVSLVGFSGDRSLCEKR